jgi:hypothetical protein
VQADKSQKSKATPENPANTGPFKDTDINPYGVNRIDSVNKGGTAEMISFRPFFGMKAF